jgi:hypothetical protein
MVTGIDVELLRDLIDGDDDDVPVAIFDANFGEGVEEVESSALPPMVTLERFVEYDESNAIPALLLNLFELRACFFNSETASGELPSASNGLALFSAAKSTSIDRCFLRDISTRISCCACDAVTEGSNREKLAFCY